jgi:hypothetical protein
MIRSTELFSIVLDCFAHIHAQIYKHRVRHECINKYMHIYMHIYIYIYMCMCMYLHTCICMLCVVFVFSFPTFCVQA